MKSRFLLDTQVFILAAHEGGKLSKKGRAALLQRDHTLFLSLVSVWEMQIKMKLGKLKFPMSLQDAVQCGITELGIELLPLRIDHIFKLDDLPMHHRDPFDRLLIAQSLQERMTIISNDHAFDTYGVTRIW